MKPCLRAAPCLAPPILGRSSNHVEQVQLTDHGKCLLGNFLVNQQILKIGDDLAEISVLHFTDVLGQYYILSGVGWLDIP